MKLLITGANSAVAFKLLKAFKGYQLIFADYGDVPSLTSANYQFISLGAKNQDVAAHQLLNCCLDNAVDLLLPLHLFELMAVAKAKVLFEEFNISVVLPDMVMIDQLIGKSRSDEFLVLLNGNILYSSSAQINFIDIEGLSGAFYVNKADGKEMLNLISID